MLVEAHSVIQWTGVRRQGGSAWARQVVGLKTRFIEPGSSRKNGYCESFNSKLRDELLNGETFYDAWRGPDADRELAAALQCRQAALISRLSAAGSGSHLAASPWAAKILRFDQPKG